MKTIHTRMGVWYRTKAQIMSVWLENNSNSLAGIRQWADGTVARVEEQNDKEIRLRL